MRKPSVAWIFVWIACVAAVGSAQDSAALATYLQQTTVGLSSGQRVAGFNAIAEYWKERTALPGGFSDTPKEEFQQEAKTRKISDQDLNLIATSIEAGIRDQNSAVRKAAALALAGAPRSSDSVLSAIEAGIKSDDATVNWYVMQQRTEAWPKVHLVIDDLIDDLSDADFNKYYPATSLLRHYGEQARPYSKRIARAVMAGKCDERDRASKMYVLSEVGLTNDAVETVLSLSAHLTPDQVSVVAISLLEHPDALRSLSAQHPNLGQSLGEQSARLFVFLCEHQNQDNPTRTWLASQKSLSGSIMGMLREPRFVEEIGRLEGNASKHERAFLAACKRACGGKAESTIDVDSQQTVKFRPASAWPKVDDSRRDKTTLLHGDGITSVMVTGEIRGADGSHPRTVRFYRTNDSMLLGSKQDRHAPLLYDFQSGRFVFLTSVFAAYNYGGNGQAEPGPYQTGSAQIRVEAAGFVPLVVQFFDEMPDVRITLDQSQ
ncbi:MAG: hypothetical protein KDB14_16890 [Planctomycetales bacterium]|nr:hypothetical protein [Planctomycetales bacterium]